MKDKEIIKRMNLKMVHLLETEAALIFEYQNSPSNTTRKLQILDELKVIVSKIEILTFR